MSVLEIMFIACMVLAVLSSLGSIGLFIIFISQYQKLKKIPNKRFKNKKKNKQMLRRRKQLKQKKKRTFVSLIIFILFTALFVGSSWYISYYQAMNLTKNDSTAVVKGYYLLQDFDKQLMLAKEKEEPEEKLQQNIRYLSTSMASYGIQKANILNSKEGQLALNRYYNALKQLGMNGSTQTNNFYGNADLIDDFSRDIKKAQEYEKVVFNYFKVSKTALSEKK